MSRIVVVSGGGTGIGRAIAATFAGAGDRVTIVGRRADALERAAKELPGDVTPVPADLTVPADVERLAGTLEHVDVVVNNAGGAASDGPLSTLDDHVREWRQELDANVLTAVLLTTALEPKLRPDGRVILMSSIAAVRGGGSYGAAKAALHGWAYALAARLGGRGITVNVVAPGLIATDMTQAITEGARQEWESRIPLKRLGTPEDIAAAVCFLASNEAAYITGQVVAVNGGMYM